MRPRRRAPIAVTLAITLAAAGAAGAPAAAAVLPSHGPLAVLVIGDDVNPHGLSDADLTQSADIVAALNAADSGLSLAAPATLVRSQCVDGALTALAAARPPDVVVYFAHLAARGCDGSDRQPALTAALDGYLRAGGGVVVFHHGMYVAAGKEAVLQLLGARASSVSWQPTAGQRVFDVAPGHFVTTNGITYAGSAPLAAGAGIAAASYPYFDNVPDERYPATELATEPGEQRTLLFASDGGGTRVLGYALARAGWSGRVVWYQPAEYQPRALDDRAGVNFQILANAIVYAAGDEPAGPPIDAALDGPPLDEDARRDAGDGMADGGGGGCCDARDHGGAPLVPFALALAAALARWRTPRRGGGRGGVRPAAGPARR